MAGLFTPKQEGALKRALAECASCRELAAVLAAVGMPNEYKEQENQMIESAIKKSLELHATYTPGIHSDTVNGPV